MIVTRMTRLRHYCALNFRGLTSFRLFVFVSKSFNFRALALVISRPVLHYEVFNVPLRSQERQLYYFIYLHLLCQQFFATKKQKFSKNFRFVIWP